MVKRARPYHGHCCKCCLRSAGFLSALTPYIGGAMRMTLFWRRQHAAGVQSSQLSALNVYELLFSNLWCFCHRAARLCTSCLSPFNFNPPWGFGDQTAIRWTAKKRRCKCLGDWRWSGTHRTCVNANASPISMDQLRQEGREMSANKQETQQRKGAQAFFLFMLTIGLSFRTWVSAGRQICQTGIIAVKSSGSEVLHTAAHSIVIHMPHLIKG